MHTRKCLCVHLLLLVLREKITSPPPSSFCLLVVSDTMQTLL